MSAGALRNRPGQTGPPNPARAGETPAQPSGAGRLRGLAEVLARHGLQVSLTMPPGCPPSLHVVNPAASVLAEEVYARRGPDGICWFWWSWAERIAAGDDPEAAAVLIKRVLAARDEAG